MEKITGKVGIPNSYFLKMAKHDYEDYQSALAREFYQNSIDAGASRIDVMMDEEKRLITVKDNGCGMSLEILTDKLLVLGGSYKASSGAVGAFGKAKEVLFFSWDSYNIRTKGYLVEGAGAEFTITPIQPIKGTVCTIEIPSSISIQGVFNNFIIVASKMQTNTTIYVGDEEYKCLNKKGRVVREIENVGVIHQLKKEANVMMDVRINGIWMFSQYIGEGMGTLVLELMGDSVDVLTSNRDGFKWEMRNKISLLMEDLIINKESAIKKVKKQVRKKIKGTGGITVGQEFLEEAMAKIKAGNNLMAISDNLFGVEDPTSIQKFRINEVSRIIDTEWDDFVDHIKFIGYEPDFILLHSDLKNKSVNKFMGTKKARLLANMWTEIIKQVLIDNKMYLKFTAGFIFDDDFEAMLESNDGEMTFFINPHNVVVSDGRYVVMEDLKDLAIHEIAHLEYRNHDANFVGAMGEIRKKVSRSNQKSYYNIQRAKV